MEVEKRTAQIEFDQDILRSIVLGNYIRFWGLPEHRVRMTSSKQTHPIEMYSFPADKTRSITRFATAGMSAAIRKNGKRVECEWLLTLPPDLGSESDDRIFQYFADLIANHIENAENSIIPRVTPESSLAPEKWNTKAILIDECRGEPEELSEMAIGEKAIQLCWLIPISSSEANYILENGIESFDEKVEHSNFSIIDVNRTSFI